MNNLELYEKVRSVPKEAQRAIAAGRLKGKTDINPMWRIKTLTEQFGVCGFGWKTEIVREWLEQGANGEITANVEIKLYIKREDKWSEAIPGIGGSALIAKEKDGLHTDDDCFKKAYTDAISVACKALGIGADVYWEKDSTKYGENVQRTERPADRHAHETCYKCHVCGKEISEKLYTQSSDKYNVGLCSAECRDKYLNAQKQFNEAEGEIPFD